MGTSAALLLSLRPRLAASFIKWLASRTRMVPIMLSTAQISALDRSGRPHWPYQAPHPALEIASLPAHGMVALFMHRLALRRSTVPSALVVSRLYVQIRERSYGLSV